MLWRTIYKEIFIFLSQMLETDKLNGIVLWFWDNILNILLKMSLTCPTTEGGKESDVWLFQ